MSGASMPKTPVIPQESALRVVKGSVAASVAATAGGSIYALMKAQPATVYGFQSGANTFVFAFPFFAIREYVVIPLLDQDTTTAPSIHTNNVLASAISGTVVGGAMSSYFRECYPFARKDYKKLLTLEATGGPQKFVSGSTTFGILSTSLQLLGNELRVLRVQYLAGRDSAGKSPDVSVDSPAPSLRNKTEKLPQLPVDSPPQPLPTTPKASSQTEQPSSWLQKAGSYLSALSPVRQISDEDYYEQLKARRRQVVEKLSEVDSIIGSEKGTQAQHKVYHSMQ